MTTQTLSPGILAMLAEHLGPSEGIHITHTTEANGEVTGWGAVVKLTDGKRVHLQGHRFRGYGEQIAFKYVTLFENMPDGPLCVPQPLAYFPEQETLVRYRFPGMSLITLAIEGNRNLEQAVYQAGAWLEQCHQLPVTLLDPNQVHEEQLWNLVRRCVLLASLPDVLPEARPAVERVLQYLQLEPESPLKLIHGRYGWDQLYWTEHGFAAVDLASVSVGDPAADAGTFLAELDEWCLLSPNVHAKDRLLAQFWLGYAHPEEQERAQVWRSLALLEACQRHLSKNLEMASHLAAYACQALSGKEAPMSP